MTDADFAAFTKAEHALFLADEIEETLDGGPDAITVGPSDAALCIKALRLLAAIADLR